MKTRFKWLLLLVCSALLSPTQAAQLAIVIDDLGYNAQIGRQLVEFPGDLTLAILPFTPHGQDLAELAASLNKEIMIHAPMSNSRELPLGPGALESNMSREQFHANLEAMFRAIPQARGLNNHMGSQLTQELTPMNWLMQELLKRDFYFVDSRTSPRSQALYAANQWLVPALKRDVFLDNQRNSAHIRQQLNKALALAKQQGKAIAIGHPYPETLEALRELPQLLANHQIELVRVSALLQARHQETARYCPAPPVLLWRPLTSGTPNSNTPFDDDFGYED